MILLLLALLILPLRKGEATSCPHTTTSRQTKPLYLLTLVPFPDPRDGVGWDGGLEVLSGARVARDEVNNHTDLLPGYHIELIVDNIEACSYSEATTGLSNLIKYTVSPPCRPVVAVIGLLCSSHTSILSPVAGHDVFDLMQLSAANSPIFQTQTNRFPHLWHFLGSAIVYFNTVLAIMDQFNWQRIGIVYDTGSIFYSENAKYLEQKIRSSPNKSVIFTIGVSGTKNTYFDSVIFNIKKEAVTLLVVLLNEQQASILLNRTLDEGLSYPQYTWIHIETTLHFLISEDQLEQDKIFRATHGHIHLHTQTQPQNKLKLLVSRETFKTFKTRYLEDLELVKKMYNESALNTDVIFARYLYDQVWALALAVNNSLPVLENRNLSIDNYTIGQPEITAVIEKEMAKLNFKGAGGFVQFDQYHSVFTPVEVSWVSDNNGTEKQVGIYNPLNSSNFHVNINPNDLPNDTLKLFSLIPFPVAILLHILAGVVIIFITVQLFLYLHYRDHNAIKATSPYLSMLMFAGCYLFCFAAILQNTFGSFIISAQVFTVVACSDVFSIANGICLILVTLFVKLLRVYHVFSSWMKKDLGSYWNNCPLVLFILSFSIIPNISVVLLVSLRTPQPDNYIIYIQQDSLTVIEEHIRVEPTSNYAVIGLLMTYVAIFLLLVFFVGVHSRKIKQKNFNETEKIYILFIVLLVTLCDGVLMYLIFHIARSEPIANIVAITGFLIYPTATQVILFLPKIVPVVIERKFPRSYVAFSSFSIFT